MQTEGTTISYNNSNSAQFSQRTLTTLYWSSTSAAQQQNSAK